MPNFKKDSYIKLVDPMGNFRFGFIAETLERGSVMVIDLNEEGLSKINWDTEYAQNGGEDYQTKDFNSLLTDIEKRLIALLSEQLTTGQIGEEMGTSPVTVRSHIRALKMKLQCETREQIYAYSQGIVKTLKAGK